MSKPVTAVTAGGGDLRWALDKGASNYLDDVVGFAAREAGGPAAGNG